MSLTANFGDLRSDHFHSGLDLKTQGETGKEVVAADDGYVYRIGVSPTGYGNSLFLRHPSGYSTIYGHLDRFSPEIAAYVKMRQYESKSFTVALYPPADKFRFKKGDLIAYSGNSGGSTGPHLHFEVRKSEVEIPVNPLLFNFGIEDTRKPVIDRIYVYPISPSSEINGRSRMISVPVYPTNGDYTSNEIRIYGKAGFGIRAWDLMNDSGYRYGIYSLELRVDSMLRYKYVMDEFTFAESRYINSHIDYALYMKEGIYAERLFVLPNDRLDVYKNVVDRGILNFNDKKNHIVEITARDINNNSSTVRIKVISADKSINDSLKTVREGTVMPYSRSNRFRSENISLIVPAGALYDTLFFKYRHNQGTPQMLSDVHYVADKYTPLQKACSLSIKPLSVPAGKESKLLLVQMNDDFRKIPVISSYSDGWVTGDILSFGMYYVGIDTVPPSIFSNGLHQGADLSGKSEIKVRITDDFSGIASYEPYIDGKWALFEYDLKYDLLTYHFDPERIGKGKVHNFVLKVTDNKNNQSEFKCQFKW